MKQKFLVVLALLGGFSATAQLKNQYELNGGLNAITTAVPFLTISPDSRAGAMGDAGVASAPDVNSSHWNVAKLAFVEDDFGIGLSYSPWLKQLVPDMYLSYLSGYKKLTKNSTIGGSMRYFSMGNITFTDEVGTLIRDYKPNEFALDASYALKLSERLATGVSLRYINSNLTGGLVVAGASTKAATAVAFDASVFYRSKKFKLGGKDAYLNAGANLSNVGNKVNYSTKSEPDFIPTMLRFGPALQLDLDEYNSVTFLLDVTKLLVPTPPLYETTSSGEIMKDPVTNEPVIYKGKNPNVTPVAGIFQSFNDAPGGFKEEMKEFNYSFGTEYLYNKQIAVRAGYFYEDKTKGNRQYITMGAGFKYQVLCIDLSYLIPTTQNNPLANTLRISLRMGLNKSTGSDESPSIETGGND